MSLQDKVMQQMKAAMKDKDKVALTALRSLKSAFILAKTESGVSDELSEAQELKIVQKQVKQRKDSASLFLQQDRKDLAECELLEVKVLEQFLPRALTETEVAKVVKVTIDDLGATSMKDMGKVMGVVSKKLAGQADGGMISGIVKKLLA